MKFGLSKDVIQDLETFFAKYESIDKVVVFGSRARADNAKKSDIDLCVYSLEMSDKEFTSLRYELINELPILYKIDCVHFEKINDKLKENILRDGKLFYIPTKTIKEIGKVITGKTPPTKEDKYWNSADIPFVKPDDFKNDVKVQNKYNTYISFNGLAKTNKIPANSVLVTCIGTIGKVIINNTEVATNQQINSIIPNDNIDSKYLMYQIFTKRKYLNHIANAPVVPIINKTAFEKVKLVKPSLTKQKQIAKTLDKAMELIELRKESIKKLDALSKSIFIDMFGDPVSNPMKWDNTILGHMIYSAKDGPHESPKYADKGIPFLSARHVRPSQIIWNDLKYIDIETATKYWKKCKPEIGDILYSKGGTTGFAASVTMDKEFAIWVHIALLKPKHKIVNFIWLENMLNTSYCYAQSQHLTKGIANKDLGLKRMVNIKFYFPPKKLQDDFSQKIKKIEQQKALYEEQLTKLQENFDALLAQNFQA